MGWIYDRQTGEKYEDNPYGAKYIHFVYHHWLGRCYLKFLILPFVSRWVGATQNTKQSAKKIPKFIQENHINMDEYEEKEYTSFNDFFTRKKKQVKVDENQNHLVSPADAKLLVYPIQEGLRITIKHSEYTLPQLLQTTEEGLQDFQGGYCFVFRLSVDDYHRYHFVDDGSIVKQYSINGKLHTVSSFSQDYPVYTENHRVCNILKTTHFGEMMMVEVGAMLVGKIKNHPVESFIRGQEKGYFEYGGSTVILLTQKNIEVDEDILQNSQEGVETKVRVR